MRETGAHGPARAGALGFVFVWGALAASACTAPAEAPRIEYAPHPQGVAIDPVLALPAATSEAEPAGGVVVLAEPVDPEPARRLVREFFEAVVAESLPDLSRVLDPAAHARTTGKPPRPEPALPWWRRRFERLDYTALGAEVFYRRSEMEAHTARDTGGTGRALPVVPRENEIVVVVAVAGQAANKLFGPEITFLVRRGKRMTAGDGRAGEGPAGAAPGSSGGPAGAAPGLETSDYKIAELYEDFRLP
ncbi:MAG TPA: hypothetical protein VHE30_26465 [Polyangiaceae bacterium]|nr:hypothetical protein [Polyangiaceae bacterium]